MHYHKERFVAWVLPGIKHGDSVINFVTSHIGVRQLGIKLHNLEEIYELAGTKYPMINYLLGGCTYKSEGEFVDDLRLKIEKEDPEKLESKLLEISNKNNLKLRKEHIFPQNEKSLALPAPLEKKLKVA